MASSLGEHSLLSLFIDGHPAIASLQMLTYHMLRLPHVAPFDKASFR